MRLTIKNLPFLLACVAALASPALAQQESKKGAHVPPVQNESDKRTTQPATPPESDNDRPNSTNDVSASAQPEQEEQPQPAQQAPLPVLPKWNATGETGQPQSTPVPVVLGTDHVLDVNLGVGSRSKEERAQAIERNLQAIVKDRQLHKDVDAISTREVKTGTDIVIGDRRIMTVTQADALAAGMEHRQQLADQYVEKIKAVVARDIKYHSFPSYVKAVGLIVAYTFALIFCILVLNFSTPTIDRMIENAKGKQLKGWRIQQAQIVSEDTIVEAATTSVSILRVLAVLLLLSIYIYLVLDCFPDTHAFAGNMAGFFISPLVQVVFPAIISYLPNIAFVVIILLITHYIIRFTHFIFKEIELGTITIKGFDPDWADTTYGIARFLLTAFSFVLIFPYLPGSGSPAFQQVSIFLGVLLSLSSTGAISHVIAGIFLTYTGAFKVGDRVKIADTVGDVLDKTLFATRIRTNKNEDVTIPNGLVLSDHIINYSSSASGTGLILHAKVTIGYEVPWRTVHQLLIDSALKTERILQDPAPFVLQTEFDGSSMIYEINAYTNFPRGMQNTYSNLRQQIQDHFSAANIEILAPIYHAVRDGSLSTVPADGKTSATTPIKVSLTRESDEK